MTFRTLSSQYWKASNLHVTMWSQFAQVLGSRAVWSGGPNSATVAVRTCKSQTRPMFCHLSFAKGFVVSIKSNARYTEVPVSKPARTMRARLTHILASMMITIEMQLYFGHPPNIHLDVRGYVGAEPISARPNALEQKQYRREPVRQKRPQH